MFIRFLRQKFFVLKFQFIEVIHSIYLILVQYVPALLLVYYNTQMCKATHITQYHKIRKKVWGLSAAIANFQIENNVIFQNFKTPFILM